MRTLRLLAFPASFALSRVAHFSDLDPTHAAPSDVEGEDGKQEQQEEEYDATVEEVRAFLQTHIEDLRLHPPTTYELLASHGRKQVRV